MGQWHWYCETHGQIDRTVQVHRRCGCIEGRCGLCDRRARWDEDPDPLASFGEQLALFKGRP
jgi:hypothetical protein